MIPINLKNHLFLIAAILFSIVGGGLLLSTMDDKPGPPPRPPATPTGFSPQMLQERESPGALLFIKTCTQCHDLPNPKSHTAEEWPNVVSNMVNRLRRRRFFSSQSLFVPEKKTINQITAYLSDHALKSGNPSLQDDKSPAGLLFVKKCTQCHALPDPALHTPSEWASVVERMQVNIVRMQKEPISDSEKETLVRYISEQTQSDTPPAPLNRGEKTTTTSH